VTHFNGKVKFAAAREHIKVVMLQ